MCWVKSPSVEPLGWSLPGKLPNPVLVDFCEGFVRNLITPLALGDQLDKPDLTPPQRLGDGLKSLAL